MHRHNWDYRAVLLALFLSCGTSFAQGTPSAVIGGPPQAGQITGIVPPASGGTGVNNGTSTLTLTGESTYSPVYNVMDPTYGAKCDGVTDDSAALTAAGAAARANTVLGINVATIAFPAGRVCKITHSVNWTNLRGYSIVIDGGGSSIYCAVAAGPCIDALGIRYTKWHDLTIVGDGTNVPTYGIQIGRTDVAANNNADGNAFYNLFFAGNYSGAAFYNFASETTSFSHSYFSNAGVGYTYIADGYNHFNITSAFVTELAPVDTPQSFDGNAFFDSSFISSGGGTPIWAGNTSRMEFIDSYALNNASTYGMEIYTESGGVNLGLYVDIHFEGTGHLTDAFLVDGTLTTPSLVGFTYKNHFAFETNSIFKISGSVVTASLQSAHIELDSVNGSLIKMFDAPGSWTQSTGSVYFPNALIFNSSTWIGPVTEGTTTKYIGDTTFTGNDTFTNGVRNGAPTGGNKGAGTINVQNGIYNNGTLVGQSVPTIFSVSGTYTAASWATITRVIGCGSGGGGGGGGLELATIAASGGGGGGGGGCFDETFRTADLSGPQTVTIGTAGTAGTAASTSTNPGGTGGAGNQTCFGGTTNANSLICGYGGGGGAGGQLAATASGGGGGGAANQVGSNGSGATGGGGGYGSGGGGSGAAASNQSGFLISGGGGGGLTTGASSNGAGAQIGCPGGGSGGGVTVTSGANNGGGGGFSVYATGAFTRPAGGTSGAHDGTAGSTVATKATYQQGSGGGGGYGNDSGTAGNGGAGFQCGGGGGGGTAINGSTAGNGGAGGVGWTIVLEY